MCIPSNPGVQLSGASLWKRDNDMWLQLQSIHNGHAHKREGEREMGNVHMAVNMGPNYWSKLLDTMNIHTMSLLRRHQLICVGKLSSGTCSLGYDERSLRPKHLPVSCSSQLGLQTQPLIWLCMWVLKSNPSLIPARQTLCWDIFLPTFFSDFSREKSSNQKKYIYLIKMSFCKNSLDRN